MLIKVNITYIKAYIIKISILTIALANGVDKGRGDEKLRKYTLYTLVLSILFDSIRKKILHTYIT